MEPLGICDGDIVVIEPSLEPRDKDIVLIQTHDGITLRLYRKHGGKCTFECPGENPIYKQYDGTGVKILGVVVYAGRRYRK